MKTVVNMASTTAEPKNPNPGFFLCVIGVAGLIQGLTFVGSANQISSGCGWVSLVVSAPLLAYGVFRLIRQSKSTAL